MKKFEEFNNNYKIFTFKPYDSFEIENPTNKIFYYQAYHKIKEIGGLYPYMLKKLDDTREKIILNVIILETDDETELVDELIRKGNAFNVDFELDFQYISETQCEKIIMKKLSNLYEPIFNKVVSFDFDGVLHKSIIKGTIHPKYYNDYDNFEPNKELIDKINYLSKTHTIIVVTSRQNYEVSNIWKFIRNNNINIHDVFTTNGDIVKKSYILKNVKALTHYDDNIQLKSDIESVGTIFNFVNTNQYFK
jgi:hypothetical protein